MRWVHIAPAEYGRLLEPVVGPKAAAGIVGIYERAAIAPAPPALPVQILKPGATTVEQWTARQDWTT